MFLFSLADIKILWEAIFLLERARNSNPQIALLLMKLYGILGANESITVLFEAISIKHLQIETIGYNYTVVIVVKLLGIIILWL